jgi:pyruvate,water dikinase
MSRLLSVLDFFSKKRQKKALSDQDESELFLKYYQNFRELLENNHQALALMADMQEKAKGAYVFDQSYLPTSCTNLLNDIEAIIGKLNVLSQNKYQALTLSFQTCMANINAILESRRHIPSGGYIRHLKDLHKEDIDAAGGKLAYLGELANKIKLRVPDGFVITTRSYVEFMRYNGIEDFIRQQLGRLDISDYQSLKTTTDTIQKKIIEADIPPRLNEAVTAALLSLRHESGDKHLKVAVRSSGIHEDVRASFAGQYKSVLNVPAESIFHEYREILVSQFSPRGIFYYKGKAFNVEQMAMAVGVLAMVDATVSGVTYSRDPKNPEKSQTLVNAVRGLGPYAVEGTVKTDYCMIATEEKPEISYLQHNEQAVMLTGSAHGGIHEVPVPEEVIGAPCLSDDQILALGDYSRKIEDHFGQPQDIEWAIDPKGRIFFLQSRPLRMAPATVSPGRKRSSTVEGYRQLLTSGTVVCRGVGTGSVCIVKEETDMADFPENGVLVIRHSDPEYAMLLEKASAVIAEIGTPLGHLATVIREYHVPAIFNVSRATEILENGMEITVDAEYANVYEGVVEELLSDPSDKNDFSNTAEVKQLKEILKWVTPLNLIDPRSPSFSPKSCRTLHDITRFCHEMAMRSMFALSKESHFSEHSAKRLVTKAKLEWWVINIGDGFKTTIKGKTVDIEDISSIPMQSLWKGMTAIPWKGPPPMDTEGFMSTVLSTSKDPDIKAAAEKKFVDRNYILVARNFCNVSTRLGFHFSTLESYIGEHPNNNYISFVFTGGGADDGRKNRRVRLIMRILEHFGFRVEAGGDALFARLEGYQADFTEGRLKILGHVIVHTRQLDMGMFNDKMMDWHYREIIAAIKSFAGPE